MSNADRIAAALTILESQLVPNYKATAKKHGVVCKILMRRSKGKTVSNQEAITEHRQALNAGQENVLLGVSDPRYTSDTSNSQKLCRGDI